MLMCSGTDIIIWHALPKNNKRKGKARHGGVKTAKDSTVSPPLLPSSPISSTVRPSWDPTHHAAPTLCLLF